MDGEGNFSTYIGPDGTEWLFYDYDTLFAHYEAPEDFYYQTYAAKEFEGEFDFSETFYLFETYTSSFEYFYFYSSNGAICELDTDFDDEGNIIGFYVNDWDNSCPYVEEGWTYSEMSFTVGDDGYEPESFTGPDGTDWYFYTEEEMYYEAPYVEEEFYFGIYGAPSFDYNFDYSDVYAFLETYDRDLA